MSVGRRYGAVTFRTTVASTFATAGTIVSTAAIRPKLYHFILSTLGAAADGVLEWRLRRFTAAGTAGTAVVTQALDPADPQPGTATSGANHSAEPTYTAASQVFDKGVNQRVTYTWYAPQDGELVAPATAANGWGMEVLSSVAPAYTGAAQFEINFAE